MAEIREKYSRLWMSVSVHKEITDEIATDARYLNSELSPYVRYKSNIINEHYSTYTDHDRHALFLYG